MITTRRAAATSWQALGDDDVCGILINVQNRHWTCIVHHLGAAFYVDSLNGPVLIDEADFRDIIRRHPDAYLVVKHDCTRFDS